ncbi:fungal hydrophobin-domain-containing protein [Phyllosticta capitalensis]|uniref:Fungal hydrophobin-domain-containing protein n=2 Tax=Phyllosticta capitalensis TaxID=121624 RepID=A0ABR1YYG0_9PEZI
MSRSHKKTTMKFLSILADLVAVSSALAINKETGKITIEAREPGDLCSSGTALCCQLDVIGVADATCVTPSATLTNVTEFQDYCADNGRTAECCTVSVGIAGLLCTPAT